MLAPIIESPQRSAAFVDFADLVPSRALSGALVVSLTMDPTSALSLTYPLLHLS